MLLSFLLRFLLLTTVPRYKMYIFIAVFHIGNVSNVLFDEGFLKLFYIATSIFLATNKNELLFNTRMNCLIDLNLNISNFHWSTIRHIRNKVLVKTKRKAKEKWITNAIYVFDYFGFLFRFNSNFPVDDWAYWVFKMPFKCNPFWLPDKIVLLQFRFGIP